MNKLQVHTYKPNHTHMNNHKEFLLFPRNQTVKMIKQQTISKTKRQTDGCTYKLKRKKQICCTLYDIVTHLFINKFMSFFFYLPPA